MGHLKLISTPRKLDDVQDCREYLDFCEESHAGEIRGHRFRPKLEQLKRRCPPLARTKRSAKKPGGNGRSTARRVVDKVKQKGRQVVDKIRNRGRGGQSNYGRGGQSNYGGNTGGGLSGTQHKESRKKKILKKVGKYAVAGLAVYGTYKLAKAMTKGLRGAYDTDDCWDYSYMRGVMTRMIALGICLCWVTSVSLIEPELKPSRYSASVGLNTPGGEGGEHFQFSASAAAVLPNGYGRPPASTPHTPLLVGGPKFDTSFMSPNITAIEGREVRLACAVFHLENKTVSWLRNENLNIISSGRYTYTSDQRFQALHEDDLGQPSRGGGLKDKDNIEAEHWILRIRNVQMEDEGRYECQISSQPIRSYHFYLKVVVPLATIMGKPEMFVDVGSTINITCLVQHTPGPPSIVQWQHNGQPIDYTSTRGGVSVLTNKAATTVSSLIIQQARYEDGGTYSCQAGDLVTPSHIKVHVIHGDNYQSLHTNGVEDGSPSLIRMLALASPILIQCVGFN